MAQTVKNPPAVQFLGSIPGWQDPLEKGMATRSSSLAWGVPETQEAGGSHSPWVAESRTRWGD